MSNFFTRFLTKLFTTEIFESRHPAPQKESKFIVTTDSTGVTCQHPSGEQERVAWDDLDVVIIETNDTGPWGTDVWWILGGRDGKSGCVVPQGATGETAMLESLQQLPGFDNEQLIAAMGCTDNKRFLCWRRSANAS